MNNLKAPSPYHEVPGYPKLIYLKSIDSIDLAEVKLNIIKDCIEKHNSNEPLNLNRSRQMDQLTFQSLRGLELNREESDPEEGRNCNITMLPYQKKQLNLKLEKRKKLLCTSKSIEDNPAEEFEIDFPLNYNNILYKAIDRI